MAEVYVRPKYFNSAKTTGKSRLTGKSSLSGNSRLSGKSGLTGKSTLYGNSKTKKSAESFRRKFGMTLLKQLFPALIIFTLLAVISTSAAPAAESIIRGMKWTLEEDFDIKSAFSNLTERLKKDDPEIDSYAKATEPDTINDFVNNADAEDISDDFGSEVLGINTLDLFKPVNGTITGLFGERTSRQTGEAEFHCGVDIAVSSEETVYAAEDGRILSIGNDEELGRYIRISHEDGLRTVYANLGESTVKVGQIVKKGDKIAVVKGDDVLNASHLHFEIWQDGMPYNPLLQLESYYSIEPSG